MRDALIVPVRWVANRSMTEFAGAVQSCGLLVLFGMFGGRIDPYTFNGADDPPLDDEEPHPGKPWWTRDEEHYREWNAHQVHKHHRIAGKHSALD